jgi:hypothetical protein
MRAWPQSCIAREPMRRTLDCTSSSRPARAHALTVCAAMRQRARSITGLVLALALAGCASLGHTDDPAQVIRGPMPTRANAPVHLMFMAFHPRVATTQPEGSAGYQFTSAYSSMYEDGFSSGSHVTLDGELWRNAFSVRYGLSPSADLEIEIPTLFATSGFLDQFVEEFHSLLFLPNSGRDSRPQFAYEMEVHQNGQQIYELEGDHFGLCDIPIVYTHRITDETDANPALSMRLGVELPTGSESRGFGNGEIDAGGGVLMQKSWNRWTATSAVDYVLTGAPTGFEENDVEALDLFDAQLGVEYRWSDHASIVTGAVFSSTVTHDVDIEELDSALLMIDLGVAWDVDASRLTVGFEEDAIAAAGPDFSFFFSWSLGI